MTRGGKRPGAGRPRTKRETKTTNLCGVRVTPIQLMHYRATAARYDMTLSQWVTYWLDFGIYGAPEVDDK
jgi:hypothetical protein